MQLWVLFVFPIIFFILLVRDIIKNFSQMEHRLFSSSSIGFLLLLLGSLVPSLFLFGNRFGLIKMLHDRFVEPWGYFGYVPFGIATVVLLGLGAYVLAKTG